MSNNNTTLSYSDKVKNVEKPNNPKFKNKEEWLKSISTSTINDKEKNFLEGLWACEELFINDLFEKLTNAEDYCFNDAKLELRIDILSLGNEKTITEKYPNVTLHAFKSGKFKGKLINGYYFMGSDNKMRFFPTDVFIYGLHPQNNGHFNARHFDPWIKYNKVPGFWQVKEKLLNKTFLKNQMAPYYLIDNSNYEVSYKSFFYIYFNYHAMMKDPLNPKPTITTLNIKGNKYDFEIYNKNYYDDSKLLWHCGNTINTTFETIKGLLIYMRPQLGDKVSPIAPSLNNSGVQTLAHSHHLK